MSMEQIFNPKNNFSVVEKLHHLAILKSALETKQRKIQKTKTQQALKKKYRSLGQAVVLEKVADDNNEDENYKFVDLVDL